MWPGLSSISRLPQIGQSRSSIINPLQWTLAILLIGLLALSYENAPPWLVILFATLFALTVALIFGAFLYFMIRNPADLRSERYSFFKSALDRTPLGDSLSGFKDVVSAFDGGNSKLLGSSEKDIEIK